MKWATSNHSSGNEDSIPFAGSTDFRLSTIQCSKTLLLSHRFLREHYAWYCREFFFPRRLLMFGLPAVVLVRPAQLAAEFS
jgi:hypothetical protein